MRKLYAWLVLQMIRPALEADRRERAISLEVGVRISGREAAPEQRERLLGLFRTDRQRAARDVLGARTEDRL